MFDSLKSGIFTYPSNKIQKIMNMNLQEIEDIKQNLKINKEFYGEYINFINPNQEIQNIININQQQIGLMKENIEQRR